MNNALRFLFIALLVMTTGLFAQAATEPVMAAASSHHQAVKVAKKKHKKHKKKSGEKLSPDSRQFYSSCLRKSVNC